MIRGQELHAIIKNIFGEVNGYLQSEQLQVNCPRCQQREGLSKPDGKFNLEINTSKRVFRCWKCDEPKFSGSLGRLIRTYGRYADYELYKSYTAIYHQDYVYDDDDTEYSNINLPAEMVFFSDMNPANSDHLDAYKYLVLDRKISREVILKYRLGFCTTGKFAKRIIIPSYDSNGELNYFVGRTYDPKQKKMKYLNPNSDKNKIVFNEGFINWDSTLYLVEGVFDMLSFPVNTIPMLGKTLPVALFSKIKEYKPNVVVLLDPDAYRNCIQLYHTLCALYVDCEDKVKIVKLPTDDDLDELRKNKGVDEVLNSLYSARGLTVDDHFTSKLKNFENGKARRYGTNSKGFEWGSAGRKNFIR